MKMGQLVVFAASLIAAAGIGSTQAGAAVIWNEAIHGELADLNRYAHPDPSLRGTFTDLGPLTAGTSTIVGSSARPLGSLSADGDAVRFVVPADANLVAIIVTHDRPLGLREFFRLGTGGAGPYFMSRTYPAVQVGTSGMGGVGGGAPIVSDLMQLFGPGDGLSSGAYVLSWENAALASTMNYSIDFVVIPSPPAAACIALGVWAALRRAGRRAPAAP